MCLIDDSVLEIEMLHARLINKFVTDEGRMILVPNENHTLIE